MSNNILFKIRLFSLKCNIIFQCFQILLRLVCCMIVQGVWTAAICGPTPNLDDFEISAAKCFRTVINYFRPNYTKFELTSG